MPNTFHVSMYVRDLDAAIERYRKILGAEPNRIDALNPRRQRIDPRVARRVVMRHQRTISAPPNVTTKLAR